MGKKLWRLLDSGIESGSLNMAVDEAILNACSQGLTPPTLRIYQWTRPTLTIGYFQEEKEINWGRCSQLGIEVVRRQTGGKAILHWDELTYSIVTTETDWSPSVHDSYKVLSQGLIAAYQVLGVNVDICSTTSLLRSPACFLGATGADLTYGGRKLVGSAQIRRNGALLQHGCLVINHHPQFLSLLNFSGLEQQNEALAMFSGKVTSLREILGKEIDVEELKEAIILGFVKALGMELSEGSLTGGELRESQALVDEKYSRQSWNRDRQWKN